MKIKLLISILIYTVCLSNHIVAQNWMWAQNFSGTSSHGGLSILVAPNGYIYSLGEYQSLVSGMSETVIAGNLTISSSCGYNGFIAQFDQAGNFMTITNVQGYPISGPNTNGGVGFISAPTADESSNIYAAVGISDNGLVDTIAVTGPPATSPAAISKWNDNSRCLWLQYYGCNALSPKYYQGYDYLSGTYQQAALQIGSVQLSDLSGKQLAFITKINQQGNCMWAKQVTGGNINLNGTDISSNQIYMTATTDSCFIYDTLNICTSNSIQLGVLAQLDTSGSIIWSKKITAADNNSYVFRVIAIPGGGCYAEGALDTTLYLGNDTLHKLGNELGDELIVRINSLGDILWVKQIPVNNGVFAIESITVDSSGYFYLAGYFSGAQTFGNYSVTAQSARDLFVTRYSPAGECMGVVTVPNAQAYAITEDSAGNAIVTGGIESTANFGNIALTASAQTNFFIAKLSAINYPTSETIIGPQDSVLQIYANPSKGLFTVVVPQSIVHASNSNLMIYDSQGSIVTNQTVDISTNHVQVDLGEITRGVYTVVLTANGRPFTGRVVIQ